jgi:hypothetical protein
MKIRYLTAALAAAALAAAVPDEAAAQGATVTCQSDSRDLTWCWANTSRGVTLSEQLSDAPCVRGRSWGFERDRIWVARGCRARFRTAGPGQTGPGDYDDRYDDNRGVSYDRNVARSAANRAERACLAEVRNRLDVSARRVRISQAMRQGNRLRVQWAARGYSGYCLADRDDGELIRFRTERRPGN